MNGRGFKLFQVMGIPIRIDLSWFLVAGLICWTLASGYFPFVLPGYGTAAYWIMGGVAAFLFFGSVLFHELSHSLVAIRRGLPVGGITLFVFGGVSEMDAEPPTPKAELLIAGAGPLSSFLLGALFFALGAALAAFGGPRPALVITQYLAFINVLLGAFNLVPGFPLDGGRLLRAGLWQWTRDLTKATRIASWVGKAFALALIGLGTLALFQGGTILGLWYVFIGLFLLQAADVSYKQVVFRRQLEGMRVQDVMTRHVFTVPAGTSLETLLDDYVLRLRYGSYPVMHNNRVLGMITLHQMREVPRERWATTPVEAAMVPIAGHQLHPADDLESALRALQQDGVNRLPVLDRDHLVGLLSLTDISNALQVRAIAGEETP